MKPTQNNLFLGFGKGDRKFELIIAFIKIK